LAVSAGKLKDGSCLSIIALFHLNPPYLRPKGTRRRRYQ
jgi:hypothetical protein